MTNQTASSETTVHHGLWLPQRLWRIGHAHPAARRLFRGHKTLLNAGYWMDGAYIAEQMPRELQAFIDRSIRSIVSPMSSMKALSGVGLTPWANPGQKKFWKVSSATF